MFKLKKYFYKPKKSIQGYPVEYLGKFGGEHLYTFADMYNIPAYRGVYAIMLQNEVVRGTSESFLASCVEQIKKAINSQDWSKAAYLCEVAETYKNTDTPLLFLLKFCSLVYFTEEEDLEYFSEDYALLKIRKWLKDKDFSFFLKKNTSILSKLSITFSEDKILEKLMVEANLLAAKHGVVHLTASTNGNVDWQSFDYLLARSIAELNLKS
jgi:hypothetical protein